MDNSEENQATWKAVWAEVVSTMVEKKITQTELARQTGIKVPTINKYFDKDPEKRRMPSGDKLIAMCKVLKINMNKIMYPDDYYDEMVSPMDLGKLFAKIEKMEGGMQRIEDKVDNQSTLFKAIGGKKENKQIEPGDES